MSWFSHALYTTLRARTLQRRSGRWSVKGGTDSYPIGPLEQTFYTWGSGVRCKWLILKSPRTRTYKNRFWHPGNPCLLRPFVSLSGPRRTLPERLYRLCGHIVKTFGKGSNLLTNYQSLKKFIFILCYPFSRNSLLILNLNLPCQSLIKVFGVLKLVLAVVSSSITEQGNGICRIIYTIISSE